MTASCKDGNQAHFDCIMIDDRDTYMCRGRACVEGVINHAPTG